MNREASARCLFAEDTGWPSRSGQLQGPPERAGKVRTMISLIYLPDLPGSLLTTLLIHSVLAALLLGVS